MHLKNALPWKRIAAPTLTAALAITGAAILAAPAATAAPAAPAAGPTQNVDATLSYTCNVYVNQTTTTGTPLFTNLGITSEIKTTLPSTVGPKQTIAKTPVTLVNDFSNLLVAAKAVGAVSAKGGSPDLTTVLTVNNKQIAVPVLNVVAPLVTVPTSAPWFDTATGTVSAITVPNNASGTILASGPTKFTIESDLSGNADGSNSFPTALACTAVSGEDLTIARIGVIPAGTQTVDATATYSCDAWTGTNSVPTNGAVGGSEGQITNEIKATLPSSVGPGGTIASTNLTDTWEMPIAFAGLAVTFGKAGVASGVDGTFPNAALSVAINGQTSASPLNDLATPLTPVPTAAPVFLDATGTTSDISVPANASGALTISAPRQLEIGFTVEAKAGSTPVIMGVLLCTANDDQDLTLATVSVVPPAAASTLTASSPKSSAYGTPVTVPASVTAAAAKPIQPGGTQSIDTLRVYACDTWLNQTSVPTDGTAPNFGAGVGSQNGLTSVELTTALPNSVRAGTTIPASDVSLTWEVDTSYTEQLISSQVPSAGVDKVSLPEYGFGVSGQTSPAVVTNLGTSALAPIPATAPNSTTAGYQIHSAGTSSPITVPSTAKGAITIGAPQQFSILYTVEPADPSTGSAVPVAVQCTAQDPLTVATIGVVGAPAKPAVPTGKVLITHNGKGVAQGTLVKGKANVIIPGTALPVGKSTLKVSYPGDSNTLASAAKTITVVKTKTSPTLAVHVTPGKVPAGAVFPTVSVKLSGPGSAKGGKFTVTVGAVHRSKNLAFDGSGSVQLPPFATAGHKVIRVAYAGNANFVAKTVTAGLNVTKTKLGKFAIKVKPAKILAKKTRATLLITLGAPDKLNHGIVTVRLAGRVLAKKLITGTGRITLPKFPSAGRKVLKLTFTGNGSVVAKTVTKAVKVTKRR